MIRPWRVWIWGAFGIPLCAAVVVLNGLAVLALWALGGIMCAVLLGLAANR